MTASGKRFIIYLSAEIGTAAAQRGGAGAVALLVLPGAAWHVSVSNARVATEVLLLLLTCQVNVIFMADCQLRLAKARQARAKPARTLRTPQPSLRTGSSFCRT